MQLTPILCLLAVLPGLEGQYRGGMKDFDNRKEGTTVELHASGNFVPLGVHRTCDPFEGGAKLYVQFYLPDQGSKRRGNAYVEAREIMDTHHYLMQSKPGNWKPGAWNVFGPWPSSDVIEPLGIGPRNIAVLAWYDDTDQERVYLPVDVQSRDRAKGDEQWTLYLETSLDVHSLEKYLVDSSQRRINLATEQCTISPGCVLFPAASSFAVRIDMSKYKEGVYELHLVGHQPGTSHTAVLPIKIYNPPH